MFRGMRGVGVRDEEVGAVGEVGEVGEVGAGEGLRRV